MKFAHRNDNLPKPGLSTTMATLVSLIFTPSTTYAVETEKPKVAHIESGSLSEPLNADKFIGGLIEIAETYDLENLPTIIMQSLNVILTRDFPTEPIKGQEKYFTTDKGYAPEISILYMQDMVHINIQIQLPIRFIDVGRVGCLKLTATDEILTGKNWIGHGIPIIGDIKVYSKQNRRAVIEIAPPGGLKVDRTCVGTIAIRFPKSS